MATRQSNRTDTNDLDTDERRTDTEGRFDADAGRGGDIEVVSNASLSEYAAELAFMQEQLVVEVLDSNSEDHEPVVTISCQGVPQTFARGQPQLVRRKYVQILATTKPETMKTETRIEGGEVVNKIHKHSALRYPFTVHEDTKKGREWLRNLLQKNR